MGRPFVHSGTIHRGGGGAKEERRLFLMLLPHSRRRAGHELRGLPRSRSQQLVQPQAGEGSSRAGGSARPQRSWYKVEFLYPTNSLEMEQWASEQWTSLAFEPFQSALLVIELIQDPVALTSEELPLSSEGPWILQNAAHGCNIEFLDGEARSPRSDCWGDFCGVPYPFPVSQSPSLCLRCCEPSLTPLSTSGNK
jgi:hypothetical protein